MLGFSVSDLSLPNRIVITQLQISDVGIKLIKCKASYTTDTEEFALQQTRLKLKQ